MPRSLCRCWPSARHSGSGAARVRGPVENDAEGTWLVYPTLPGWHYRIEGSPSPAGGDFTYVPGSFRYGGGQDQRWWIAPPPPPLVPPDPPPPPRLWRHVHVTIFVATDPGVQLVKVVRAHPEHPWAALLTKDRRFQVPSGTALR